MNDQFTTATSNIDDYINTIAIFGEVNKIIISKNFKGGSVTNIFGNTLLDFSHADINGIAILDISQVFGEMEIIVPRDWRVDTNISQFCAVIDDGRSNIDQSTGSDKILLLKGISGMANIDITNF